VPVPVPAPAPASASEIPVTPSLLPHFEVRREKDDTAVKEAYTAYHLPPTTSHLPPTAYSLPLHNYRADKTTENSLLQGASRQWAHVATISLAANI
jgi:hypothetical protein